MVQEYLMFNECIWGRIIVSWKYFCFQVFVDYISFRFYVKYIWKKCYKNILGAFFWAPIPLKRYQNTSGCGTVKWKPQQLVSELLDSIYRGNPKTAGVYLEISYLDCLTTKKLQVFSTIFPKFHQNPRIFQDSFKIPELSGTSGNHVKC